MPQPLSAPDSARRPWGVWVIAVVVLAEAALMLGAGIYFLINLFVSQAGSMAAAVFLTVICLGLGAGLVAVGMQGARGFRWTRAATLVWQLIMLTIAVPLLIGGLWIGWLGLAGALAVLILLFTPAVVTFTVRQGGSAAL
ncbi:hypothetical protein [Psychromicrobium xiongbiense]|uniref:hypothetical protein n=1 Tax=Psychromicrobium xiongbiense TaxID=3051184 RepID=UPI0025571A3C|nr:hypothetical protein [Psychromicrobium sp. YIM S02556]